MSGSIEIPACRGDAIVLAAHGIKYGFRYDPMRWVREDRSVDGAKVRNQVFKQELEGDRLLLEQEIENRMSAEGVGAALADPLAPNALYVLGMLVLRLMDAGCTTEHPYVKTALAAMLRQLAKLDSPPPDPEKEGMIPFRVLCLLGSANHPVVKQWGMALVERLEAKLAECKEWDTRLRRRARGLDLSLPHPRRKAPAWPYGIAMEINTLWLTREHAKVDDLVGRALAWIEENLYRPDGIPGMAFDEEWSMAMLPADNGHPLAAGVCVKLLPILMKQQRADGGWGRNSLTMFRLLTRHGLLSALLRLPPWPPDWRTVRSIPAPGRQPMGIAADGGRIWVCDIGDGKIIAVSPEDGSVLTEVDIPDHHGLVAFGAWDGSVWVMPGNRVEDPKTIYQIDQETGQVGSTIPVTAPIRHFATIVEVRHKLLIPDQEEGGFWTLDDAGKALYHDDEEDIHLSCPMPDFMSVSGDDIWTLSQVWFSGIMKTNADGHILDWGELPFGHGGIAHDGRNLWALDPQNKRICIIEKRAEHDAAQEGRSE